MCVWVQEHFKGQTSNPKHLSVWPEQCWICYRADDLKKSASPPWFPFSISQFSPSEWGLRIVWVVVRNLNLVHRSLFERNLFWNGYSLLIVWYSFVMRWKFRYKWSIFRHRLLNTFHYSFHNAEMKRSANIISWFLEHAAQALIISCELCCLMWLHSLLLLSWINPWMLDFLIYIWKNY